MSVILPGSYDPVTLGHLDIIRRAAEKYDEVYVVVFTNPKKEYMFSVEDRVRMLMIATDDLDNVMVSYSNGLVIDYMTDHEIEKIIKGYRNEQDLEWERQQVRQEILDGSYRLDTDVDISLLVDFSHIYNVGEGRLIHDRDGFRLTGCDGRLEYIQKPQSCYGLYADYYWYEIADVICIGDNETLYYCFPKNAGDVVAKTRLAVEEMYKLYKSRAIRQNG